VLPILDTHTFTFLIEDPATSGNLGRNGTRHCGAFTTPSPAMGDKLAIDLNIVDRYQNVYPTKQQTGTELFDWSTTRHATSSASRCIFENSLLASGPGAAALRRRRGQPRGADWAKLGGGIGSRGWAFRGAARLWWMANPGRCGMRKPCGCRPGRTASRRQPAEPGPRLLRLNGELKAARQPRCALHRIHLSKFARANRCARSHAAGGGDRFRSATRRVLVPTLCCFPRPSIS